MVPATIRRGRSSEGLQPLQIGRDLRQVIDLIEVAFGDTLDADAQRALDSMRLPAWLAPVVGVFDTLSLPGDGIMPGFVWLDGGKYPGAIETGTTALGTDTGVGSFEGYCIGGNYINLLTGPAPAGTKFYAVYIWDRAISAADRLSILEDPWQVYTPPRVFALADVPDDVRFGVAKKPWTKKPPPGTPIDRSHPG